MSSGRLYPGLGPDALPGHPALVISPWRPDITLLPRGPGVRLEIPYTGTLSNSIPRASYSTASSSTIPVIFHEWPLPNGATRKLPIAQINSNYLDGIPGNTAEYTLMYAQPMGSPAEPHWLGRSPTSYSTDLLYGAISATTNRVGIAAYAEGFADSPVSSRLMDATQPWGVLDWSITIIQARLNFPHITSFRYQNGKLQRLRSPTVPTLYDQWPSIPTTPTGAASGLGGTVCWHHALTDREEEQAARWVLKNVLPNDVCIEEWAPTLHPPPETISDLQGRWGYNPFEPEGIVRSGSLVTEMPAIAGTGTFDTGNANIGAGTQAWDIDTQFRLAAASSDFVMPGSDVSTPNGYTIFVGMSERGLSNNRTTLGKWTFQRDTSIFTSFQYDGVSRGSVRSASNAQASNRGNFAVIRVRPNNTYTIWCSAGTEPMTGTTTRFGQISTLSGTLPVVDPLNPPGVTFDTSGLIQQALPQAMGWYDRVLTDYECGQLFRWARNTCNGYFEDQP